MDRTTLSELINIELLDKPPQGKSDQYIIYHPRLKQVQGDLLVTECELECRGYGEVDMSYLETKICIAFESISDVYAEVTGIDVDLSVRHTRSISYRFSEINYQ